MTSKDLSDFYTEISDIPLEQKFLIGLQRKPYAIEELEQDYSKVSLQPSNDWLKNTVLKRQIYDINKARVVREKLKQFNPNLTKTDQFMDRLNRILDKKESLNMRKRTKYLWWKL